MENIKKKVKGNHSADGRGCYAAPWWLQTKITVAISSLCDSSDRLHISQHTIVHDYFMVKCVLLGVSSLKMYSCPIVFI